MVLRISIDVYSISSKVARDSSYQSIGYLHDLYTRVDYYIQLYDR